MIGKSADSNLRSGSLLLRDSRLRILGDKSPIRKVRGLESTTESNSEYVPSKTQHNSHNTEECISLRKIVERLIREGKLDQYIARPPQAPVLNGNRQINMINTISGGPTLACTSNRSVKQYVRVAHYPQVFGIKVNRHHKVLKVGWEPITFYEEEEEGILCPHDDPMIIRADITDYDVGRVLIDIGSSVNVIFAVAFRGMGISGCEYISQEV
ncbi:uncharacterized protein LOC117635213 [Prunus dulcis]|uniref:uncharacterized protein LOC117635213 n=1 Tax=Prunus dulcis TaxID=3755 RepID=UPI0014836FB1|nr:uncharacterized protein LOC117635213 [Prunus dulcis]